MSGSRKKLFILHILPLEYYPPILNLLKYDKFYSSFDVKVFTSLNHKNRPTFVSDFVNIIRVNYFGFSSNGFLKLILFFLNNLSALYYLIIFRPSILFYYEPHSSFPVYLYKRFFNSRVNIFIHNHELYTESDFNNVSMKSIKFVHKLEKKYLYPKAKWISQTNQFRLNIFKQENEFLSDDSLKLFPNYPPKSWNRKEENPIRNDKIRMIYFGALSFENTYIKEIVSFVSDFPDKILLDIYSYNLHSDVEDYLMNNPTENINFYKNGIDYYNIPDLASNYDLGLILYKAHNINYTYNAPNKLFEYLSCGLNVWVSSEVLGCKPFINPASNPFVKNIDFNNLNKMLLLDYFETDTTEFVSSSYCCEPEFDKLIDAFSKLV